MSAIEKIEKQQEDLKEGSAAWCTGEQLKEICEDARCAELLDTDLDNPSMSIVEAEKKIKAFADKTKTGNFAFVSPKKADEILRDFYGLPAKAEMSKAQPKAMTGAGIIDLADFL